MTTSNNKPLNRTHSISSDCYYQDDPEYDDPAFLEALSRAVLPGDAPPPPTTTFLNSGPPSSSTEAEGSGSVEATRLAKRKSGLSFGLEGEERKTKRVKLSSTSEDDSIVQITPSLSKRPHPRSLFPSFTPHHRTREGKGKGEEEEEIVPDSDDPDLVHDPLSNIISKDRRKAVDKNKLDVYGESHFGDFGEYMTRKRAKLQIQNDASLGGDNDGAGTSASKAGIFKGLAIYINGYTNPSIQVLRTMILKHGGTFHAYLDRKRLVTHIITAELTPAKAKEWKHMKIVRPEWLVQSVNQGRLLSWRDFAFRFGENGLGVSSSTSNGNEKRVQGEERGKGRAQMSLNGFVARERVNAAPTPPASRVQRRRKEEEHELVPDSDEDASLVLSAPPPPPPPPTSVPPPTTDPICPNPYASKDGNVAAAKAMQDPSWRAQHTSGGNAQDFIEGFYKHSRLHYLSTWKSELKELVNKAREAASASHPEDDRQTEEEGMEDYSLRKGNRSGGEEERVIMHCDFDCFFVSAGLVSRPELRGRPLVVCHSQNGKESSTSEIASASYEARKFGIKNGMSLRQARTLCKDVITIPYEFEKYKEFSLRFYTILMKHADRLEAVSVDEALIDVTCAVLRIRAEFGDEDDELDGDEHPAKKLAERIRDDIRQATECEVSIGIATNPLLARLATRRAKPAKSYLLLSPTLIHTYLSSCDITDIRGFGYQTAKKAQEKFGTTNLGELEMKTKGDLIKVLGKVTGETLFDAIRGVDRTRLQEGGRMRKSVSCDITYGIRFEFNSQAKAFILDLAREVSRRMKAAGVLGKSLTVKVLKRDEDAPVEAPKFLGHGVCETFTRQVALTRLTDDPNVIGATSWQVVEGFNVQADDLRGIGIQVSKLESVSGQAGGAGARGEQEKVEKGQAKLMFKPIPKDQRKDEEEKEKAREKEKVVLPVKEMEQVTVTKNKGKQKAVEPPSPIVIPDSSQEVYPVPDSPPLLDPLNFADQFLDSPAAAAADQEPIAGPSTRTNSFTGPSTSAAAISARPNSFAGPSTRPNFTAGVSARPQSFAGPSKRLDPPPPPPPPSNDFDLPSFSQVDMSVFNDLPDDVRRELEDEYKKRSAATAKPRSPTPQAPSPLPSNDESPKAAAKKNYSNFKGIAKQFGARGQPSVLSQRQGVFGSRTGMWATSKSVQITDEQLKRLNIDPEVFRSLPVTLQREQLSLSRFVKERGAEALKPFTDVTRIEIRPDKKLGKKSGRYKDRKGRRPNPKAVYPTDPPTLKQHGKKPGEKISYSSTADVQAVIEKWVDKYKASVPGDKDIDYFALFLVQCLDVERSTDTGMEKAVECLRWWLVLLRRYWREWEREGDPDVGMRRYEVDWKGRKVYTQECIGRSWWAAFRKVKSRMDQVISERFGGRLAI